MMRTRKPPSEGGIEPRVAVATGRMNVCFALSVIVGGQYDADIWYWPLAGGTVMIEAYLITLAGLIAMQISPGPNVVAIAGAAMGHSRQAAIMVAVGIATGAAIWVTLVALGIGRLIEAYPQSVTMLKLVGGSYLLWLGLKGLRAAWQGKAVDLRGDRKTVSLRRAWMKGLLVVMTNPKVALGWAAIASFLFGSGLSTLQVAAFAPLASLSAIGVYVGYALLLSTGGVVRAYQRFWRAIEGVFGSIFGTMGGSLVLSGIRDIRSNH